MTDIPTPLPRRAKLKPPTFQTPRVVSALMLREMSSTYGRSPGGYLWAILEPVGAIAFLSLGFSLLIRAPALGTSFILFYATGYLPFDLYGVLARKIGTSINYSRALLAYPNVLWIDAIVARFLLNVITSVTVTCIILTGILAIVSTRTVIELQPILIGMSAAAALGLGVGVMNCLLFGLLPVWQQVWGIVTRPLFLASGLFYIYEDLPQTAQNILWWNPLLHITGLVRTGFYPTYHPNYISMTYCFGVALLLIFFGLIFLRAYHKTILER